MNKEVLVFNSSDGKSRISGEVYTPAEGVVVRAVVQISHGMCEYIGRYENFARALCDQGVVVCGNDHLGHKNTALLNREKLGYFGEFGARNFLVEDLELFRREIAGRYPGVPYFMLGHSMGSFIARLHAQRFGSHLDGLIISGTSGKNPAAAAGKALAKTISFAKGPKYISQTLYDMSNGAYAKAFPQDGSVGWLSRDKDVCAAYLRDNYCTFKFTASAYYELFDMLEVCNSKKWYEKISRRLPILIISGETDPVGNGGQGPREVYEGLMTAGHKDVRLKLYPGARHETHNETCKEEVYADIMLWLEEMTNKSIEV